MSRYLYRRMNRELRKRKFKAIGSGALILMAVATYIGFASMVPSTAETLETKIEDLNLCDYIVRLHSANESSIEPVSSISGVQDAEYRLIVSSRMQYSNTDDQIEKFPSTLIGIDSGSIPRINALEIRSGDGDYFSENESGMALVDRGFAYKEGIEPGDRISVLTESGYVNLTVKGLAFSPEYVFLPINPQSIMPLPGTLAVVYLPIDWLRQSFNFDDGYINEFTFLFDNEAEEDSIIASINENLASNTIIYSLQKDQIYGYALIKEDLSQGDRFNAIIAFIILLVAFFVVYSSFTRIVQEQRGEIGVLRALGYSRRSVFGSYIYMALLIGFVSSIIGVLIGIPVGRSLTDFYVIETLHIDLLSFTIPFEAIVTGVIFGPVTASLACGIAVWRTVSLEPQNAIRGFRGHAFKKMHNKKNKRKSFLGTRQISYMTLYAWRNISRYKMRTLLTVIAVAFAVLLGSMSFLMIASFANSIESNIQENEHWDLVVDYSYSLNETSAEGINSPLIEEKAQIAKIGGSWEKGENGGLAIIIGMERNQTLHEFNIREGVEAQGAGEIMVGYNTANENDIAPGDNLELQTPNGTIVLLVTALVEDMMGEIFVDIETVESIAGRYVLSGMYVKCAEGQSEEAKEQLLGSPLVADVQLREGVQSGILDLMESYNTILYAFSLVGVAIATMTIANIVYVSILERHSEYGQLKAIGYSQRDVSKSILMEIMLMVSIGSIIAIPFLLAFMESLVGEFRTFLPMYKTILYFSDWIGYVYVVLLIFIFSFIAAIPGTHYLKKMDIGKIVTGRRFG